MRNMIFDSFPFLVYKTSTVSDGNMSYGSENLEKTLQNRTRFLESLQIDPESTVSLKQILGKDIIVVGEKERGIGAFPEKRIVRGDGLITNVPNTFLLVKAADCHQIAFFDQVHKAIGLIHAGRKGLELGIIREAIVSMKKQYYTVPQDLLVQFGPSIGPCHYFVDIWQEAEQQLQENGVLQKHIDNPRLCTYEHEEYFSHRRAMDRKEQDLRHMTVFGILQ